MTASSSKTDKPHLFKPGQSGNPSGRAKKTPEQIELEAQCRALTPDALDVITKIMRDGDMEKNRLVAAQYILDRGWGKAAQEIKGTLDHSMAVTMITRRII